MSIGRPIGKGFSLEVVKGADRVVSADIKSTEIVEDPQKLSLDAAPSDVDFQNLKSDILFDPSSSPIPVGAFVPEARQVTATENPDYLLSELLALAFSQGLAVPEELAGALDERIVPPNEQSQDYFVGFGSGPQSVDKSIPPSKDVGLKTLGADATVVDPFRVNGNVQKIVDGFISMAYLHATGILGAPSQMPVGVNVKLVFENGKVVLVVEDPLCVLPDQKVNWTRHVTQIFEKLSSSLQRAQSEAEESGRPFPIEIEVRFEGESLNVISEALTIMRRERESDNEARWNMFSAVSPTVELFDLMANPSVDAHAAEFKLADLVYNMILFSRDPKSEAAMVVRGKHHNLKNKGSIDYAVQFARKQLALGDSSMLAVIGLFMAPPRDIHSILSVAYSTLEKLANSVGVKIEIQREGEGPALILLRAAATLLEDLAINLISNGIKYRNNAVPEGERLVSVTAEASPIPGHIRFIGRDNGRGMSPVDAWRYGDPTFRAQEVKDEEIPGTGVGSGTMIDTVRQFGGSMVLITVKNGYRTERVLVGSGPSQNVTRTDQPNGSEFIIDIPIDAISDPEATH